MSLPYNLDAISLDSDRKDGNIDGKGNSIAGELLPDTLVYQGIPFVTGPKLAGGLNAVSCAGQAIDLPNGRFDRLYLLAAAVDGPASGEFAVDFEQTQCLGPGLLRADRAVEQPACRRKPRGRALRNCPGLYQSPAGRMVRVAPPFSRGA